MSVPERFLGFAFSVGDLLIETGQDFIIHNVDGAVKSVAGIGLDQILNRSMLDFIADEDRSLVENTVKALGDKTRMGPLEISMTFTGGVPVRLAMFVGSLPTADSSFYFVLAKPYRLGAGGPSPVELTEEERATNFIGKVQALLEGQGEDDALGVTVMEVIGAVDLDPKVREHVEKVLGSISLGGSHASSLGGNRFAVVHDQGAGHGSAAALAETVQAQTGIDMSAASVATDDVVLSGGDGVKALAFSLQQFADGGDGFDVEAFSNPQALLGETTERVKQFRQILNDEAFSLVYQPIVSLKTGETRHFEVLSRFDVNDSNYSQWEMITFAEDVGLIQEFDAVVLRRSIARLRELRAQNADVRLAVNMSGRSLSDPAFMRNLMTVLEDCADIRPQLSIEITESAKIKDLKQLAATLEDIRALGVCVYLDDFGAGVSGFQYLRQLVVDAVKIDGSYIRDALDNAKDRAFLSSMVTLCKELGIVTVGEWVETHDHAVLLSKIGVDYGQGYHFGKPLPGLKSVRVKF